MSGEIQLEELTKSFGEHVAVAGIDVDMPAGEFFTLLGPSGCGKTTTLRMIAGFEEPTSGTIELAGVDVRGVPPYERAVNTVATENDSDLDAIAKEAAELTSAYPVS